MNDTENELSAAETDNAAAESAEPEKTEAAPADAAEKDAAEAEENTGAGETASDETADDDITGEGEKSLAEKLRSGFNVFLTVFTALMVAFIAYIMACSARGKPVEVFGRSLLTVVTGSMEPSLHTGDYIYVKRVPADELEVGDVITFRSEESDVYGKLVTHRIIEITPEGDFITKGDANKIEDSKNVREDQIVGKYIGKAKFFKWINSFADRRKILLILVIIPMTLMALYEVRSVSRITAAIQEKNSAAADEREMRIREAIEKEKERLRREGLSDEEVKTGESGKTDEA